MRRSLLVAAALLVPAVVPATTAVAAGERLDDLALRLTSSTLFLVEASLDDSIEVRQSADLVRVRLEADVLFAPRGSKLKPDADPRLSEVGDRIEAADPEVVTIVGPPVPRTSPARLSRQQAAAVARGLREELAGTAPRMRVLGARETRARAAQGQITVTFAASGGPG